MRQALLSALLSIVLCAAAFAEKRVALVIGNGEYVHANALLNPKNDATDMAAALKAAGFTVIAGTDLDKTAMERKSGTLRTRSQARIRGSSSIRATACKFRHKLSRPGECRAVNGVSA